MVSYRCGLLVERRSRFLCKAAMLTIIASILLLTRYFPRGHPQQLSSLSQSRPITNRHLLAINFSVDIADQITECSEIHSLANDQLNNQSVLCEFVKTVPACQSDTGFIPYFQFIYCVMPINLLPLSMILLFFWLLFLFLFLGTTAEEYFCPALTVISQVLRLSQNVAGVTLLAFGNGAPDIFSALAAINQPNIKRASLAFGALFGAGMFVTTIVVGAVVISKPFMLTRRPYMRDLIFYLAAVYWTFFVLWNNEMNIFNSLGFIGLYICYVLVVIFGRLIYQKFKTKKQIGTGDIPKPPIKQEGQELKIGSNSPSISRLFSHLPKPNGRIISQEQDKPDIPRDHSPPPTITATDITANGPAVGVASGVPAVFVVEASCDIGHTEDHKAVNEEGQESSHLLSSRERCASRASQHVYGVSDEEDDDTMGEGDRPIPPRKRRIRRTISGALDITEDVGLVAVGTPNLSKIWHQAYKKELMHEGSGRVSPRMRRSPVSHDHHASRSRASSHLEFSSSHREPTDTEVSEEENQEQPLLGSNEHSVSVEFVAPPTKHPIVKLLLAFWPFGEAFRRLGIIGKIYEIAKIPIVLLLTLTVPVIDKDEEDDNWNRWLNILQCITAPVFISFTTKFGFEAVGGVFPGFGLALILGMALALLIALTSSNDKPPRYHCVFAWLGFLVAVMWIYSVANEIVNLLQVFGIVINISDGILGVTLLAWGNSIGDAVANVTMARQGFPRMAIGACFGGPLLNMLLGIGIASTVKAIKQTGFKFGLYFTQVQLFASLFLMLSLSSSLVISSILRFRLRRFYGVFLWGFYLMFLLIMILAEVKVFNIIIPDVLEQLD